MKKRGSKVFLCFLNTGRNAFLIGSREKEGFLMHFQSKLTQLPLVSASSLVSQNFSEAVEIAYVRTQYATNGSLGVRSKLTLLFIAACRPPLRPHGFQERTTSLCAPQGVRAGAAMKNLGNIVFHLACNKTKQVYCSSVV